MAKLFERLAIIIVSCFLSLCSCDTVVARTLKGTIKGGKYIAPNDRFSFAVPPNAKVQDRIKVIPVAHFYQRTFYPVPSSVDIPLKTEWLKVQYVDSRGLSNEIYSMPITGDTFTPLSVSMHHRAAQRFLQDIVLPEWFASVSRETWIGTNLEYMKLDDTEALITTFLVPPTAVKGVKWTPEGARFHMHFNVLTFLKDNWVYMLVQSEANYALSRPEFVDSKKSLQNFYRAITFNTSESLSAESTGLAENVSR